MLFMSYEAEREYLDDLNGDGYGSNELARAFAESRRTTPRTSRSAILAKAEPYVRNGLSVVISRSTVYCRVTDGIIGDTYAIHLVGTREACEKYVAEKFDPEYDDIGAEVIG